MATPFRAHAPRGRRSARLGKVAALSATLCVGLGLSPIIAQDGGGLTYRLGVSQDFRGRTNPGLSSPSGDTDLTARTNLSFGFSSETRVESFTFNAGSSLVASNNRESQLLSDPSVSVGYTRQNASMQFSLGAFANQSRITTSDLLLVELEDELGLEEGLFGVGIVETNATQRRYGANARLDFGRDAPFGGSVFVSQQDRRFSGTTNPDLVDSTRRTAGVSLRFDLTEVLRLNTGVTVTQFDEDGAPKRQTEQYSLGLALDRPDGSYSVSLSSAQTPEGGRNSLSFGRQLELPRGTLGLNAGVNLSPGGRRGVIGSVSWSEATPNGSIGLSLSRSVTSDARDRETVVTRFNAQTTQSLTPDLVGQASLGLQESTRSDTDETIRNLSLSASVRYALTPDWGLRAGADHRIRRTDTNTASSSSLFLTLDREFIARR